MQTGFEKSIESPRIPEQHKLSVGFSTGDVALWFSAGNVPKPSNSSYRD